MLLSALFLRLAQAALATYSDIIAAEPDTSSGLQARALFKLDHGDLQVANLIHYITVVSAAFVPQPMAVLRSG